MDQPDLDEAEHHRALTALGRANVASRTAASLWPAIRRAALANPDRPVRVLDVAAGGGQVAIALARRAVGAGLALEVIGGDASPVAVRHARTLAARAGVQRVEFRQFDAHGDAWPTGIDVVVSTLFLHHLDDGDAVALLARMRAAAGALVLVSDIRRSRLGYLFAAVGCRLLSRSRVFHIDGTRSVRAAFTAAEAGELARQAGMFTARVTTHWPQRWLVTWERDR